MVSARTCNVADRRLEQTFAAVHRDPPKEHYDLDLLQFDVEERKGGDFIDARVANENAVCRNMNGDLQADRMIPILGRIITANAAPLRETSGLASA